MSGEFGENMMMPWFCWSYAREYSFC